MNQILRSIFIFALLFGIVNYSAFAMAPTPPTITQLSNKINIELTNMDQAVAVATQQLSGSDLNDKITFDTLKNLYNEFPSTVIASTIDPNGNLVMVFPQTYQSQGESVKSQAHFQQALKTKKPGLSNMFKTVEGFYATSLIYPIFTDKNLTGFISLVFQPQALFNNNIKPNLDQFPSMEALAIQLDGRIIYDRDILQVGQMTFSDPMYQTSPSLLTIAQRMTSEASGSGTYTFLDKTKQNTINKTTQWDTISLYQTQWRLILAF